MDPIMQILFDNETVEGGGGDGGGTATLEGSEVGADAGLGHVEPVAPEAALEGAAAAEPLALGAEELRTMMAETVGSTFEQLLATANQEDEARRSQLAAEQSRAAAPELPEWDPFNPDVVKSHMAAMFEPVLNGIMERFAPALETSTEYRNQQGEQEANTVLDQIAGKLENTEFDRERAIERAALLHRTGVDPQQALEQAAADQIKFEQAIEARGIERFTKQAQNLADGGQEPSGGGGAAAEVTPTTRGPNAYRDQLNRSLTARGMRAGIGAPTG